MGEEVMSDAGFRMFELYRRRLPGSALWGELPGDQRAAWAALERVTLGMMEASASRGAAKVADAPVDDARGRLAEAFAMMLVTGKGADATHADTIIDRAEELADALLRRRTARGGV